MTNCCYCGNIIKAEMNMKIVIASNNKHKIYEMNLILSPYNIEVIAMDNVVPKHIDIDENGSTYYENSLIKAKTVAQYTSLPVLADDSGIEVEALNNGPGLFSARYAEKLGGYQQAMKAIINECEKKNNYNATFICDIVLVNVKDKPLLFEGIVPGKIINKLRGNNGFGYDPVFISNELNDTFANLDESYKLTYSHRAKALQKMVNYLKDNKLI